MSSTESPKDEALIGSRLKMKIKFTAPADPKKQPPSSSSSSDAASGERCGDELVKKELDQDQQNPSSEEQNPKSGNPAKTPFPSTPSPPSTMGKRKKKPKQMHDEFLCHPNKRMRKSFSLSKSNNVVSGHGIKYARRRRSSSNGLHNFTEEGTRAMARAEELQTTLGSEFPTFTKLMVASHVINGFWMGVPGQFSKAHLPRIDSTIILEDESEKEFHLKYIAEKMGLSAGWRKFSVEQKLLEGDVLVFQLVESTKFKVHVVRANDLNEVDGALSLLNLEAHAERNDRGRDAEENGQRGLVVSTTRRRRIRSLPYGTLQKRIKKAKAGQLVLRTGQLTQKLENGFNSTGPSSSYSQTFGNVENFEDFTIVVDGLCIDSELPENIRSKYYELCSSKSSFLHDGLIQGLNSKLIAGIICETVDISDSIRSCTFATSRDEFANWEKTLKSFELLGMGVGFLRARVRKLLGLAFESDDAIETRKYVEAKLGRVQAEDEIINLETKIVELKEASEKYNADVEALKVKAESYELKFQEEVEAPW